MIVAWFFFDFNAAIILFGLWWKVQFISGVVVFENSLVVGARCFFGGVEGAKTCEFTINSDLCYEPLLVLVLVHSSIPTGVCRCTSSSLAAVLAMYATRLFIHSSQFLP